MEDFQLSKLLTTVQQCLRQSKAAANQKPLVRTVVLPRLHCRIEVYALRCLQAPIKAHAFRAEVTKWWVLVRLLLSDVPERTELTTPALAPALQPYFDLTAAVRAGDLITFRCGSVVGLKGLHQMSSEV